MVTLVQPVQLVTSRMSDSDSEVSESLLSVDQNAASTSEPTDAAQPATWRSPVRPTRHITVHSRHTSTSHHTPYHTIVVLVMACSPQLGNLLSDQHVTQQYAMQLKTDIVSEII